MTKMYSLFRICELVLLLQWPGQPWYGWYVGYCLYFLDFIAESMNQCKSYCLLITGYFTAQYVHVFLRIKSMKMENPPPAMPQMWIQRHNLLHAAPCSTDSYHHSGAKCVALYKIWSHCFIQVRQPKLPVTEKVGKGHMIIYSLLTLDFNFGDRAFSYTACRGNRIAQLVEHWSSNWKVASSNRGRSSGEFFFSRVDCLCWFLFGVCSTPMLLQWHIEDPDQFAKSASGRLHLNMHTPLTKWCQSGLIMLSWHTVETNQGNELTWNLSRNALPQSSRSQLAESLWTDPGVSSV